ncbi:MAG: hypothetical protein JNM75_14330 [Rhodospirillales bacterium]|nr:hypothetical protein [Rhodospirillales bacterium]
MCRIALTAFVMLYLLALIIALLGTFGPFGIETDPLAGVFLVPLGFPWNLLVDAFPDPLWPWLAAAAPLLNLLGLWLVCRVVRARKNG